MRRITLTQYLVEQQREKGVVSAELRLLVEVVARACKSISNAVSKGALTGILGNAGSDNVQGEAQKKLDVISNEVLLEANEWGGHLAAMASEEMEHPHQIPNLTKITLNCVCNAVVFKFKFKSHFVPFV